MTDHSFFDSVIAPESVATYRLPNGMRILIRREQRAPIIAFSLRVGVGNVDDPDQFPGLAHLVEHLCLRRVTPAKVTDRTSEPVHLNGYTEHSTTTYHAVLPKGRAHQGLKLLTNILGNPAFESADLSSELDIIRQELPRYETSTRILTRSLVDLLYEFESPASRDGSVPGLGAITCEEVRKFHLQFYRPSNSVLAIVGDITSVSKLTAVIAELFTGISDSSVKRAVELPGVRVGGVRITEVEENFNYVDLAMGWPIPARLHPDHPALAASLSMLLLPCLGADVRTRLASVGTDVKGFTRRIGTSGILELGCTSTAVNAPSATAGILESIQDLHGGKVGARELGRWRKPAEAMMLREFESVSCQASFLSDWEMESHWHAGSEWSDSVLGTSAEHVVHVACEYLTSERASVAVCRPYGSGPIFPDPQRWLSHAKTQRVEGEHVPTQVPVASPGVSYPTISVELERTIGLTQVWRAAHGLAVLHRDHPRTQMAYFRLVVPGGRCEETIDNAGISEALLRACQHTSSKSKKDVHSALRDLGAVVDYHAGPDETYWHLSVPSHSFAEAIRLFSRTVVSPSFDDGLVSYVRRRMTLAANRYLNDPQVRPGHQLYRAAHGSHSYSRMREGSDESLARLTPERLSKWHSRLINRRELFAIVVGDIDPEFAATHVAQCLAPGRRPFTNRQPPPDWPAVPKRCEEFRRWNQSHMQIAVPAPSLRKDGKLLGGLLATVHGRGRKGLFSDLREAKGLVYSTGAFAFCYADAGLLIAYATCSSEHEDEVYRGVVDAFVRLRNNGVSSDDLASAKAAMLQRWGRRIEHACDQLDDLADAWFYGSLEDIDSYRARLRAITVDDINNVAREYVNPKRRAEGMVWGRKY